MKNPKIKSALIGGPIFGVLAVLPYIGAVSGACCALYIGGGVLAAYLYMRESPPLAKAPYGDGAVVGVLAGVFGAIAGTVVGAILTTLGLTEDQWASILAGIDAQGIELPETVRRMMSGGAMSGAIIALSLVFSMVLYSIFATIGGLVGVAIFHKKAPAESSE